MMKIGELAEKTDVSTSKIRYYDSLGLLPDTQRGHNGYRLYGPSAEQQLRLIKFTQSMGFSLEDMPTLIPPRGGVDKEEILAQLKQKQKDMAAVIHQLEQKHRTLCCVVEQLETTWGSGECVDDETISHLLSDY